MPIPSEPTYNNDAVARWLAAGNHIKHYPVKPLYPSQERYLAELDSEMESQHDIESLIQAL